MTYRQPPLLARLWLRKIPFFLVFYTVATLTYGALYALDFYPEPVTATAEEQADTTASDADSAASTTEPVSMPDPVEPLPVRIEIDALGKSVSVLNPTSRSVADLDAALLEGVVRHPDSADFNEPGNMLILGHSSYLPNVFNKNYQAFNGLQDLAWGDTIRVFSADREYIYRVDRVYEAKASAVVVPNSRGKAKLTLATCNSFGSKDDRFIVEATLVRDVPTA